MPVNWITRFFRRQSERGADYSVRAAALVPTARKAASTLYDRVSEHFPGVQRSDFELHVAIAAVTSALNHLPTDLSETQAQNIATAVVESLGTLGENAPLALFEFRNYLASIDPVLTRDTLGTLILKDVLGRAPTVAEAATAPLIEAGAWDFFMGYWRIGVGPGHCESAI